MTNGRDSDTTVDATDSSGPPPTAPQPTRRPNVLCVLAAPRTGSNLLCYALENIPGARSVLELFHPRWIGCLDAAELESLAARAGGRDAIPRWRSTHPGRTLDMLLPSCPSGPLVVKVFPGHVAGRLLRRELLQRTDAGFVVLARRPIDSFISTMKATIAKKHHGIDTTALRPSIDPLQFATWAQRRRRWFRWLAMSLDRHAIRPAYLSYDADLAPHPLAAAAAVAARFGFAFSPQPRPPFTTRQDLEDDVRRRVANWEAFAARVDPALLAWALETPPPGFAKQ